MRINSILLLILFLTLGNFAGAQRAGKKTIITGIVSDMNQKPIDGAIILIDKKKTDVLTNAKGYFKIRVNRDDSIITAFKLGYGLIEIPINGRTNIDFKFPVTSSSVVPDMKIEPEGEEINVGYGTINRKDITSSVGKIDSENRKYAIYENIYDMIRGEVPGVQVSGNSIRILGSSTFQAGTDPLILVDGVVVNTINDINPRFVKSIEVLKGPSASIYGSRGANGVILITLIGNKRN